MKTIWKSPARSLPVALRHASCAAVAFGVAAGAAVEGRAATTYANPSTDVLSYWQTRIIFGQTFTAPADSVLDDFTFWLDENGTSHTYDAYVYKWAEGSNAVSGGPLFSSLGNTTDGSTYDFEPYTMVTDGLELDEGETYVAFFEAISGSGGARLYFNYDGADLPDGHFAAIGDAGAQTVADEWDDPSSYLSGGDLVTVMNFSTPMATAPIPASLPLLGAGLGALGWFRRRRPAPCAAPVRRGLRRIRASAAPIAGR